MTYARLPDGSLVFSHRCGGWTSRPNGWGVSKTYETLEILPKITFSDFEPLLAYYTSVHSPFPFWKAVTDEGQILNSISLAPEGFGGSVTLASRPIWAHIFPSRTQVGLLTGQGIALLYKSPLDHGTPRFIQFSICNHNTIPGTSATACWHPANCTLCGLDLSVDSGD